MSWGFVYVLGNDCMPGIYKIGMTEKAPQERLEQLSSSTSAPVPFWMAFYAQVRNAADIERQLHAHFADVRVNPNREFFSTTLQELREAFEEFAESALIHEIAFPWESFAEEREAGRKRKLDHFHGQCHEPFDWNARRGFE
jgi:hypothetical protein